MKKKIDKFKKKQTNHLAVLVHVLPTRLTLTLATGCTACSFSLSEPTYASF